MVDSHRALIRLQVTATPGVATHLQGLDDSSVYRSPPPPRRAHEAGCAPPTTFFHRLELTTYLPIRYPPSQLTTAETHIVH